MAIKAFAPPVLTMTVQGARNILSILRFRADLKANLTLRDRYLGRRCFILGSGPSIKGQDLSGLRNECVISLNNFFVHEEYAAFMQGDGKFHLVAPIHPPQTYAEWCAWFADMEMKVPAGVHLLFGLSSHAMNTRKLLHAERLMSGRVINWYLPGIQVNAATTGARGLDPTSLMWAAETASVYSIIYALYMGFSEVILLGMDHNYFLFKDEKDMRMYASAIHQKDEIKRLGSHFYSSELRSQSSIFLKYELLSQFYPGRIFNASAGGILEIFPRKSLNSYLTV